MVYTHVQSASARFAGTASGSVSFTSPVAAGNLLPVAISRWTANGSFINGLTWITGASLAPEFIVGVGVDTGNAKAEAYYVRRSVAGAHTLQLTLNVLQDFTLGISEYSGLDVTVPLSRFSAIRQAPAPTITTPTTPTLDQTDNLVWSMALRTSTLGTNPISPTDGGTARVQSLGGANMSVGTADRRVTSTAGVSSSFSYGGTDAWDNCAITAVFREEYPLPIQPDTPTGVFPRPPLRVT